MLAARLTPRLTPVASASCLRDFSSSIGDGIIEMREYVIKPEGFKAYLDEAAVCSDVRRNHMPFLGMFTPETGGAINKVFHFYAYKDLSERETVRQDMVDRDKWLRFLDKSRPHMLGPAESRILREAAPIYAALNMPEAREFRAPDEGSKSMYELREYQLHPGYGSVPKLIDAFARGLPHKVASDPEGRPVMFAYTEVGMLNTFIELWRYPTSQASTHAREAARGVPQWKEAVAEVTPHVQWFRSTLIRPVWWSVWK